MLCPISLFSVIYKIAFVFHVNNYYNELMNHYYFLYVLECSNGAYYTGITNDPKKRWQQHLLGRASKYTRSFTPKRMAGLWMIKGDRALAQQIESHVKKLSRHEKDGLIAKPECLVWADLVKPCDKVSVLQ